MTESALTINFTSPARPDSGDFVLLEQEAWDPYVNYLTKAGVYAYLNKNLFEAPDTVENCSGTTGLYTKKVFAYPSPSTLPYRLGFSHGFLGLQIIEDLIYTEAIQCNLETELTPKYPAVSITRWEWVGDAYDQDGTIVQKPSVVMGDKVLTLSQPIYGTVLVSYWVIRHTHQVTITKRAGAEENAMTSFAWAVWTGGNTYIKLEAPDGADDENCNNSVTGDSHFEHVPGSPGYVDGEDEIHEFDYCSGEEL